MSGFFMGVIHLGRGVILLADGRRGEAEALLRRSVQELGEERTRARARASSGQIPSSQSPESHVQMADYWHDAAELRLADLLTRLAPLDRAPAVLAGPPPPPAARVGAPRLHSPPALGSLGRPPFNPARFPASAGP